MQLRPVPDVVWRTAEADDTFGDVAIKAGDTIVLGLGSAAQEAREANAADCTPLFGGNRGVEPHPTHACPAYNMAMGVLLGIVTAVIEAGPLPSPSPTGLTWRGTVH